MAGQKETVLTEIIKAGALEKYLATPEGRLMCDGVIDEIRDCTMSIVNLAVNGGDDSIQQMSIAALKIRTCYNFMLRLANIAAKGIEHDNRMG